LKNDVWKMKGVQSFAQLQQQIGEVRKGRIVTNFFLDSAKHSAWIANGDCYTETVGDTLFIIRCGNGFWNVFYSSCSIEQLSEDLRKFLASHGDKPMMFDVVGREMQCLPVVNMMNDLGCKEATSLVRMTRMAGPFDYTPDSSVSKATLEDMPLVSQMLHEHFDERMEQIPYDVELCDYAKRGHVLLCKERDMLAGFLIYEVNASTLYLRYWFTAPDYRGGGIGSRLLRRFFEEGKDTRRQLLWVIRSNENAVKRYRHYGFKEEDMCDFVMQYKAV